MNKIYKARIIWITPSNGGRKSLPQGDKYAPIIINRGERISEQKDLWSLIVNNKTITEEYITLAEVHYLSDDAPSNLATGFEFDLYEGSKKVAEGKII